MPTDPQSHVDQLVTRSAGGDLRATDELLPLVYNELRRLATGLVTREGRPITPTPGDLVHEVYLRLLGSGEPGWKGRGHFFGAAAQAMRRILVERARHHAAIKHGGGQERVTEMNGSTTSPIRWVKLVGGDYHPTGILCMDQEGAPTVTLTATPIS